MDAFHQAGLPKWWLVACKRCWIFLHTITVSNLANAIGTKIPSEVMKCHDRLPRSIEWPIQVWPSKQDRTIEREAFLKVFVSGDKFRAFKSHWGSGSQTHPCIIERGCQQYHQMNIFSFTKTGMGGSAIVSLRDKSHMLFETPGHTELYHRFWPKYQRFQQPLYFSDHGLTSPRTPS